MHRKSLTHVFLHYFLYTVCILIHLEDEEELPHVIDLIPNYELMLDSRAERAENFNEIMIASCIFMQWQWTLLLKLKLCNLLVIIIRTNGNIINV